MCDSDQPCYIRSVVVYLVIVVKHNRPIERHQSNHLEIFVGWDKELTCNRVRGSTIYLHRRNGGLRLLSICCMVKALSSKMVLWTIKGDNHPLKLMLRNKIRGMSWHKWGCVDFSWCLMLVTLCQWEPQCSGKTCIGHGM